MTIEIVEIAVRSYQINISFRFGNFENVYFNLMKMKVKEIIKLIEADGWCLARQKGSHMQFKHPKKKGLVTVAAHKMSDDIPKGTEGSIMKQAQLK